jgi:hypothetical protein
VGKGVVGAWGYLRLRRFALLPPPANAGVLVAMFFWVVRTVDGTRASLLSVYQNAPTLIAARLLGFWF